MYYTILDHFKERPIITISQHLQLELPELDGTITVSINAFEEETFTQPITGSSIIKAMIKKN